MLKRHRESSGKTLGTWWEYQKQKRNLNPSFLNGKEIGSSWYVESSHWLPEISTPKSEVLLGSLWGNMPGTWELFALTPHTHPKKRKKKERRRDCIESPLSSGK
jgi:hypothetical protein